MPAVRLAPVPVLSLVLAGVVALASGPASAQPANGAKPGAAKPATARPAAARPGAKTPATVADPAYAAYQIGHYKTALDLAIERANAKDDPVSMVLAAELLSQGYGVRQDAAAAHKWYEAAAAKGNGDALFTLGSVLMDGQAVTSRDQAVDYFRRSAEAGNMRAAYNLGLIYLQGEVAPKEPAIAAEWFQRAADRDQPDALYALATLYRDGNGVARDPIESARLLQRASLLGNAVATTELAILVFNGNGLPKDEARAAGMFREAALAGNAIAQNRYARILSAGRGAPKDLVAAAAWHLNAKAQKLDDPVLDKMVAELTPEQRAQAEARVKSWTPNIPTTLPY
ncbi:sel1 repeat family protein [Starkeya koreensis]|uniref:Sel1 repeat family protein n=1 Tax=Ancylobacter koreensis TaxID=266121 RepID=A0ABT0DLV4_9HYPH|nr:tetratricopeptide repeat protein [Ancylobacter koreensis]MCK0208097.1 sel1 repeat family protein [Ancylobacter koreensis]